MYLDQKQHLHTFDQAILAEACQRHNDSNVSRNVACHIDTHYFQTLADLEKLASLGTSGENPGNCKRDLIKLLAPYGFLVQQYPVPLRCGKGYTKIQNFLLPFLLPHLFLVHLWTEFAHSWERLVCEGGDQLARFWASQEQHPAMAGHPMRRRFNWARRAIPIALHGDGVPVSGVGRAWSKSMLVLSFCSILGRGKTAETNFLICCLWSVLATIGNDHQTMMMVWQVICWSLTIAWKVISLYCLYTAVCVCVSGGIPIYMAQL
jgi:hypothetical protein